MKGKIRVYEYFIYFFGKVVDLKNHYRIDELFQLLN